MNDRSDIDVARLRARLEEERARLLTGDADSAADRAPVQLDQTSVGRLSRMDALQQQSMALATSRRRAIALSRIEAALARIQGSEYGWCQGCGRPIPARRLELDPTVPDCVACAEARGA